MSEHFQVRERCPACDGVDVQTIFSRGYAEPNLRSTLEGFYTKALRRDYHSLLDAEYTLQRCRSCALVFQQQIPDEFLLGRLYEEWIDTKGQLDRLRAGLPPGRPLAIAHQVFLSLSLIRQPSHPLQALDYGCGWGEWALMTRAFGADGWGTEFSPTRREYCLQRRVRVVDEAELVDGDFDLINLDEILEHLPKPRATLAMLATKLRTGGVMRISVPNASRVAGKLRQFDRELSRPRGGRLYLVAPLQHLSCFCGRSLMMMAEASGLKRVVPSWRVLGNAFHLPEGLRPKARALIRPFYLRSDSCTELFFAKLNGC